MSRTGSAWTLFQRQASTFQGKLYFAATIIGTVAIATAFYDPIRDIVNGSNTSVLRAITAICLSLSFSLKLPYLVRQNAILSVVIVSIYSVGWLIVFGISVLAASLSR